MHQGIFCRVFDPRTNVSLELPIQGNFAKQHNLTIAMDDNWGEFEVRWEDPAKSLEKIEAKVIQLEKVHEGVMAEGMTADERDLIGNHRKSLME